MKFISFTLQRINLLNFISFPQQTTKIKMQNMRVILTAFVVLAIALDSCTANPAKGNKKDAKWKKGDHKMGNSTHHMENQWKTCFNDDLSSKWGTAFNECHKEFSPVPSSSTAAPLSTSSDEPNGHKHHHQKHGKHGKGQKPNACVSACMMKKFVSGDSPKIEDLNNFALNLNETVRESFLTEIKTCVITKGVSLTSLSMENKCESWKGLNDCFHNSIKKACKIPERERPSKFERTSERSTRNDM